MIRDGFRIFGLFPIIGIVLIVLYLYMYISGPKRAYKKDIAVQMAENIFTFKESSFTLQSKSTLLDSSAEIKYVALFKVCDTREYLYLFFRPTQAYILAKTGIIDGTPEQIRVILQNYIPKKKYFIKK